MPVDIQIATTKPWHHPLQTIKCSQLNLQLYNQWNKWSKQFDIRPHRRRRRMVESYSPGGANVPSHVDTLAPPNEYNWTCASFDLPESTTQTAHGRKSLYFTMGRPFPPKLSLPMGHLDPHIILDFLVPSKPKTQTASRSVQPFSHRWPQSVPILYNGTPIPLKIAPSHRGIWTRI